MHENNVSILWLVYFHITGVYVAFSHWTLALSSSFTFFACSGCDIHDVQKLKCSTSLTFVQIYFQIGVERVFRFRKGKFLPRLSSWQGFPLQNHQNQNTYSITGSLELLDVRCLDLITFSLRLLLELIYIFQADTLFIFQTCT